MAKKQNNKQHPNKKNYKDRFVNEQGRFISKEQFYENLEDKGLNPLILEGYKKDFREFGGDFKNQSFWNFFNSKMKKFDEVFNSEQSFKIEINKIKETLISVKDSKNLLKLNKFEDNLRSIKNFFFCYIPFSTKKTKITIKLPTLKELKKLYKDNEDNFFEELENEHNIYAKEES